MRRPTFITWDQLRVGALVLTTVAVLGYATVRLGDSVHLFSKRYTLYTLLPSASGLRSGGSVSVAGQPAGIVRSISFLPVDADTTRNLIVELEIDQDMRDQVRSDSRAVIRTLGLLGDKALDISSGTPGARVLQPGDTLEANAVLDYDRLLFRAAGAVEDVVTLTSDLRTITAGLAAGEGTLGMLLRDRQLYDGLAAALRNSNALLAKVRDSKGTFTRLLDDPALYDRMVASVSVVDSAARLFASDKGTIGRLLSDSTVYLSLSRAAGTADALLQGLGSGRGTAGKLLTDDLLYEQLLRSVSDLTAILDDFRRNPARYTRGMIRIF